jgi:hypothetical protein
MGTIIEGELPIYIGIYVYDIIYFSVSNSVEHQFEQTLGTFVNANFMGQVSHFLGIEFQWDHHADGRLSVTLTQESFAESLIDSLGFTHVNTSTYLTTYCSGHTVIAISVVGWQS